MGKARKVRKKLHAPAPAAAPAATPLTASAEKAEEDTMSFHGVKDVGSRAPSKAMTNPFKGMKITTTNLKQVLPDFDNQSAITSKTFKELNMKKKDKRKLRHDLWMEKIDSVKQVQQKAKAKKKREKTAVVGDMQLLVDALPTLELLQKQTPASVLAREKKAKKKGIATEKQRKEEMLHDIKLFQQVLKIPEFKANPAETMLTHLRNKMQKEEDEMDT